MNALSLPPLISGLVGWLLALFTLAAFTAAGGAVLGGLRALFGRKRGLGDGRKDVQGGGSGGDPEDAPGEESEDGRGDAPGEESEDGRGDAPGGESRDDRGDTPGGGSGDDPEDAQGEGSGDDPEDAQGEGGGDDRGDAQGGESGDDLEVAQGEGSEDDLEDAPGEESEDEPEDAQEEDRGAEIKAPLSSTQHMQVAEDASGAQRRLSPDSPLTTLLFQLGLGWAFFLLLLTALSFTRGGLLQASSFALPLLFVPLVALGWKQSQRELRRLRQLIKKSPASLKWNLLLLLGVSLPFVVGSLLPQSDWDSAAYHLPLAERLVSQGPWGLDPLFEGFAYPGGVHLLYATFLIAGLESAILPLNLLVVWLTLLSVGQIAGEVVGWRRAREGGSKALSAGLWAALSLASAGVVWQLGADPRIDNFLALYCALAVLALVSWLENRAGLEALVVCAAGFALALSTKYTVAPILGTSALVILAEGGRRLFQRGRAECREALDLLNGAEDGSAKFPSARQDTRKAAFASAGRKRAPAMQTGAMRPASFAAALGLSLVVLLGASPWYVRNSIELGDPLYPRLVQHQFRNAEGQLEPVHSRVQPFFASLSGIPTLGQQWEELPRTEPPPKNLWNLWDLLLGPSRYARKPGHFMGFLLFAFIALPLVRRQRSALALWTIALLGYGTLASLTYLLRYALPALPLMAAGAGVLLAQSSRPWRRLLLAPVLGLSLLAVAGGEAHRLSQRQPIQWLSGKISRLEWLAHTGYNGENTLPELIRGLNLAVEQGKIEPDAKLLFIGEAKGHLLHLPYLADTSWQSHRWALMLAQAQGDLDQVAENLRAEGFRYVLFNRGYLKWVSLHVPESEHPYYAALLHFSERFLSEQTRIVLKGAELRLGRLLEEGERVGETRAK